jgi:hypothetical protein
VDSEEKEKSMSVFGWDLFAGLFVCIARAEDTFETALSWSCSVVRSCDAATAASQRSVCAASFTLFDFFSFFGMLPQRQRKTQKYCPNKRPFFLSLSRKIMIDKFHKK